MVATHAIELDSPSAKRPKLSSSNMALSNEEHDANELHEDRRDDSDDSDSEKDHDASQRKPQPSERKRLDNAVFSAWLARRAERATDPATASDRPRTDNELISLRQMMAKQESSRIVSDPREYQLELFERAKKSNIIAVLPTGSGKTLIAVLLLRHILEEDFENRRKGGRKKVAFFLVDKVALCFQQFAVLEANIDHPIARLCGDVNFNTHNKPSWDNLFDEHEIVVCTAEILYQCLGKAFITMDGISLLVFDEAHHCKKGHPYARIIKEFYVNAPKGSRPRLFGMSASPVDSKEDVEESAIRLETLLDCRVATTSDLSLLQQHNIGRPDESIVEYARPPFPYLTELASEVRSRCRNIDAVDILLRDASELASELGEWCADRRLAMSLSGGEDSGVMYSTEQDFYTRDNPEAVEALDNQKRQIREATELVLQKLSPSPRFERPFVSDKGIRFINLVNDMFNPGTDSRCLVFVQKRLTATLLEALLEHFGSPNIHFGVLIGIRATKAKEQKVSVRDQMQKIIKFRKGELNLLIATSIAEEGLDIPDCNCVIRFDLYSTMIQYVQSRGRARHSKSRFISMVEAHNNVHRRIIGQASQGERLMREFCRQLPEDRLLKGNDENLDAILKHEKDLPVYRETETGAQITFNSAMGYLEYFVACLPQKSDSQAKVNYEMFFDGQEYYCEVLLPDGAPIHSVTGRTFRRKALAKRSAAFETCLQLRSKGYLTNRLLPIYHKQLPAMRNALLGLNAKNTKSYTRRVKPSLWERERGSIPNRLYVTVIMLQSMRAVGRPAAPIALLTRSALPLFPSFPLYTEPNGRTNVLSCPGGEMDTTDPNILDKLTVFTLRIFQDLFNKKYESNIANMSYWFMPLVAASDEPPRFSLGGKGFDIDWDTLSFVEAHEQISWNLTSPHGLLENVLLIDPWDGGRRLFTEHIDKNLKPSDPVPDGCASHRYTDSIINYSVSLFKNSREGKTWNMDQPVIKAYSVPLSRNWLDEWPQQAVESRTLAFVCPEPFKISALPTYAAAIGYAIPSIIHRFEEYLISREAVSSLGLSMPLELSLEALTKDSDNTEEHRNEQQHFQRGMGKNYERLEFIGDAFLKMATSISLFAKNTTDDEFESHVKRMVMICNKNLLNHALNRSFYEFIRSKSFSRRTWYPEGLVLLEGKGTGLKKAVSYKHDLGDKTIADVSEAVIGGALLAERDINRMDMATKAVTVMVQSPDHDVQCFADYAKLYVVPSWEVERPTAIQLEMAEQIEAVDGYAFRRPRLLRSAFIHPSCAFPRERIPCYQRLEFLGDALLDMACVNFLFHRFPTRDPQWLTEHKMAMVSNKFLGTLCVHLGFHKHIRHFQGALVTAISEYVQELNEAYRTTGGAPDYWMSVRAAPKCLPDVVEAYIGALFIDSGFDYAQVERFFDNHVAPFFMDMGLYDRFASHHPTTFLGNMLGAKLGCSHFRVLADEMPTLENGLVVAGGCGVTRVAAAALVHGKIIGEAEGSSVRYAKERASRQAAEKLKDLDRQTFRTRFKCDCRDDVPVREASEDTVATPAATKATTDALETNGATTSTGKSHAASTTQATIATAAAAAATRAPAAHAASLHATSPGVHPVTPADHASVTDYATPAEYQTGPASPSGSPTSRSSTASDTTAVTARGARVNTLPSPSLSASGSPAAVTAASRLTSVDPDAPPVTILCETTPLREIPALGDLVVSSASVRARSTTIDSGVSAAPAATGGNVEDDGEDEVGDLLEFH